MKQIFKTTLFLLVIFSATQANAQLRVLQVDSFSLLRDTLKYGDSVEFVYSLKNVTDSNLVFNDTLNTYIKTDLDSTRKLLDSRVIFVSQNDTIHIRTRIGITNPHFALNKVTEIVIWPEGTDDQVVFSPNFDSMKLLVYVVQTISVPEYMKNIANIHFYPNPAKDVLFIDNKSADKKIENIVVRDLQGRSIQTTYFEAGVNKLDIKDYEPGVYLLEVQFTDKSLGAYRIIKTQ